jgi:hypothetical protein
LRGAGYVETGNSRIVAGKGNFVGTGQGNIAGIGRDRIAKRRKKIVYVDLGSG